ncbi:hypothetical protein D9756_008093 [Leucocoprinus leucothites]|uniref:Protein kinase domain-containing protein n=1 Tax=Leucocoprinus leucothites TaxID=201217 RepID=A0A8H5D7B8_9AGAR|nr:hypothetical protein D9756_008093 [Leucoagaricus leucothites]
MSSRSPNQKITTPTVLVLVRRLLSGINARAQDGQSCSTSFHDDQQLVDLRILLAQHVKTVTETVAELGEDSTSTLVNFLDRVCPQFPSFMDHLTDSKERARTLALLSKIVATTHVFPGRLVVERVAYHPRPKAIGGSGSVHQGIDPSVCVKVMVQVDPSAFAPWVRELILWAHSSHPNLLQMRGVFLEDFNGSSHICLVSPFMENGNLRDYAPRLPQRSRLPLLSDVINGLFYLHGLNIVHSDLKGQNVLITAEGRAVITDFGSSRVNTTTTATTTASSYTLCFAAPELVVGGERATKMCDVWSFGCLCYETLSRKPPYHQYKQNQIFAVFLRGELPQRPGTSKNPKRSSYDEEQSSDDDDEENFDLIDDQAWSLIVKCCVPVPPEDRLGAPAIQELIANMIDHPEARYESDASTPVSPGVSVGATASAQTTIVAQFQSSISNDGSSGSNDTSISPTPELSNVDTVQNPSQPRPQSRSFTTKVDPRSLLISPAPHRPGSAIGILGSLELPDDDSILHTSQVTQKDDKPSTEIPIRELREQSEKREKKGFWGWARSKAKDQGGGGINRDRARDIRKEENEGVAVLHRMIGFLTATACEDWALVLDVCDRASASEINAKMAVKALRREFKYVVTRASLYKDLRVQSRYGESGAQLSAARLWAIMLRNCLDTVVSESMDRKFLDTLEDTAKNPRTSPVVVERLLDVIAAAAYASGPSRGEFRELWRRVKPDGKPDEGVPLSTDDPMLSPSVGTRNMHSP